MAHGMDTLAKLSELTDWDSSSGELESRVLAGAFRRVAQSASAVMRLPETSEALVAAARDARAICRAASDLTLNGSALVSDLTRAAFTGLATLHLACRERLAQAPGCDATQQCLQRAEACQELYLEAYMRARGFVAARGVGASEPKR